MRWKESVVENWICLNCLYRLAVVESKNGY